MLGVHCKTGDLEYVQNLVIHPQAHLLGDCELCHLFNILIIKDIESLGTTGSDPLKF